MKIYLRPTSELKMREIKMKRITLFLIISNQAYAIDYTHCSKFLEKETPKTYLILDKKGNIKAETKKIDFYETNSEHTKFNLKKSWADKKYPEIIESVSIQATKQKNGSIIINHYYSASIEKMQHLSMLGHRGSLPKGLKLLTNDLKTTIELEIKNNKCYPAKLVRTNRDFTSRKGYMDVFDLYTEIRSETCRKILEFFDNNPSIKDCSNAKSFKKLKEILKDTSGHFDIGHTLLKELDKKLSEAYKLINVATTEVKKCDSYLLADAIRDDNLWKEETHEKSTSDLNPTASGISK